MEDGDLDIEGLQRLAEKAREIAEDEYILRDRYGFLPKHLDVDNREWGSVEESWERWKSDGGLIRRKNLSNVYGNQSAGRIDQIILDHTNFEDFSFVAQTVHSLVFLARSDDEICALRITAHPESNTGKIKGNRADCNRPDFPGIVQGLANPLNVDDILQIEIMPPVFAGTCVLTQEEQDCFNRYLKELLKDTCYDTGGVAEFAILPDGMLMGLDPSDITHNSDFWDMTVRQQERAEWDSLNLIQDRFKKLTRLPDALRWLDKRGKSKQQKLYKEISRPESEDDLLLLELTSEY